MSKINFRKMYLVSEERFNALTTAASTTNMSENTHPKYGTEETNENINTQPSALADNIILSENDSPLVRNKETNLSTDPEIHKSNVLHRKGMKTKPPFRKILTRKYHVKNNNSRKERKEPRQEKNIEKK